MLLANILFEPLPIGCRVTHLCKECSLELPVCMFGVKCIVPQLTRIDSRILDIGQVIRHILIIAQR